MAVRYICAGTHPDHDTICTFRRVNRKAFEAFFVHVLEVAAQSGVIKRVGTVSVDGSKVKASASKHAAVSHGRAVALLEQLENEVAELTARAEQADAARNHDCEVNLPEEIARREQRRSRIKEAVAVIEARNAEKVGGHEPSEVDESVDPKSQYNFTDPQSRIMKAGSGGQFEQCYNAQAAVDTESMLIVGNHLSDQPTDKQLLEAGLQAARAGGFEPDKLLADCGYLDSKAIERIEAGGVKAYVAVGRQCHRRTLESVLGEDEPEPLAEGAGVKERMAHKLASKQGKAVYRLRKQTVEPVFGIIKEVLRFRQFLMRGKDKAATEWNLVCTAYNLKRTFNLLRQQGATACPAGLKKPA